MPHDIVNLHEVLMSLGNQSIKPDIIYANIPYTNKRIGEDYVIPNWLNNWPGLTVLRSDKDYGPLTKLFPSLLVEQDPNTLIITVDDDKLYAPDTLRHLVWYAEQDASAAWGLCGWAFMWVPLPYGVATVYIPWWMRSHGGRSVDVLQAACGIAYRRKFFDNLTALAHPHKDCFTTDDMWISGYLATVANVPRYLTPGPFYAHWRLEPDDANFLKKERLHRLSDTNKKVGKDWSCIIAVETQLGRWTAKTAGNVSFYKVHSEYLISLTRSKEEKYI
jgi:hypothetical protein